MESRRAIVMEGYTDCITLQQFGLNNVVGTLGVDLTEEAQVVIASVVSIDGEVLYYMVAAVEGAGEGGALEVVGGVCVRGD